MFKKAIRILVMICLAALFISTQVVQAATEIQQAATELQQDPIFQAIAAGCQKLKNPQNMLDNEEIRNLGGAGTDMADFLLRARCEGMEKMLTAKYGSIFNTINSAELGIGKTTTYTYKNLCYSFYKLQYEIRDNPTAIVKLILMFSYPEIKHKSDRNRIGEFMPYFFAGTVDYLTTISLVEIEKLVYVNDIGRPEIYKRFYSALLTGNVNDALWALNRIPDKEAAHVVDFCARVRGEKR